jgi:hypothetical protein
MGASLDNDDMRIKVAIVDDDEGIRTSLSALIRRSSALRLTGDYRRCGNRVEGNSRFARRTWCSWTSICRA